MNSYEQLYQSIMNNIRNNILNSYGVSVNNENTSFGQNALFGQNIQLNQGFQNILQGSLDQKNKYIKVLSEDGKNSIQYVKFKKNEHDETFCPICQDDFLEEQVVAMLPCSHIFQKDSILQWLTEESHKCPVCRYEMEYIEKKDERVGNDGNYGNDGNDVNYGNDVNENNEENEEDISNNTINYRNRVLSFLELMNERREEREIQRAIEESLKTMNGNKENDEFNLHSDDSDDSDDLESVD